MDRAKAALVGLLVVAVLFGAAMLMRIAARLFFALSYLLEAVGVLAFALVAGWLVYRVLAGGPNDPRTIESMDLETE